MANLNLCLISEMIITLTNGGDTVCKGYFYRNLRKNDLPDIERGKLLAEVLDVSLDDLVF